MVCIGGSWSFDLLAWFLLIATLFSHRKLAVTRTLHKNNSRRRNGRQGDGVLLLQMCQLPGIIPHLLMPGLPDGTTCTDHMRSVISKRQQKSLPLIITPLHQPQPLSWSIDSGHGPHRCTVRPQPEDTCQTSISGATADTQRYLS